MRRLLPVLDSILASALSRGVKTSNTWRRLVKKNFANQGKHHVERSATISCKPGLGQCHLAGGEGLARITEKEHRFHADRVVGGSGIDRDFAQFAARELL